MGAVIDGGGARCRIAGSRSFSFKRADHEACFFLCLPLIVIDVTNRIINSGSFFT